MLENYLADFKASLTASPIVADINVLEEFITSVSGFLECKVLMIDGSELYISEYFTMVGDAIKCDKYSYHLQKGGEFLVRWDNAPHHRELSTFPFHEHRKDSIYESKEMTIDDILHELEMIINGAPRTD